MYSDEEKVAILQQLWASGLPRNTAARMPGWPCYSSLTKWERQADAGELPAVRPERPAHEKFKRYEPRVKAEALRLCGAGVPTWAICERLGIAHGNGLPRSWERAAREGRLDPRTGESVRRGGGRGPAVGRDDGALEARNAELELQNRVPGELLLDPKAGGLASLSTRRRVALGESMRTGYGISLRTVLTFLGISRSTYEYNRARLGRPGRDEVLAPLVREAFESSGGTYCYRRVRACLARRGTRVSEKVVRRSMRGLGLVARSGRTERSGPYSSYAGEASPAPPNLPLGRHGRHDFRAAAPNELWLTDITELRIPAGKLYLSPVLDCFDGLDWSATTLDELADDVLGWCRDYDGTRLKG